ncbi:MAG: alpha-L-fucosidase [Phycisphaerales bacterium]|nr:MAG: alpha-L-fucosidase [Phycisphaerales bacterium]
MMRVENGKLVKLATLLTVLVFTGLAQPLRGGKITDPLVKDKLEWWRDLKFGLFVHWAFESQWGCENSSPMYPGPVGQRHRDRMKQWEECGKDFGAWRKVFFDLNKTFNPKKFDPSKWATAARNAGMKYVVFTTKQHTGGCFWDTQLTDYRTTHPSCPFSTNSRADITKAVFEAFRREGFGIGVYFSKCDWHHPDYWRPDIEPGGRNTNCYAHEYPERWARFVRFTHGQIMELMMGYGPVDILWLDAGHVRPRNKEDIDLPRLASMARVYQPGLLVVDRYGVEEYEDYRTPENYIPPHCIPAAGWKTSQPLSEPWETCKTMGTQWGWKPNDEYKPPRELIHMLVEIVAKGGNLLLNIGADADGRLPEAAVKRLEEIGAWIRVNKEAIYGTRIKGPYQEGRTFITRKDKRAYLIYLAEEDETIPPAEISVSCIKSGDFVRMLGVRAPIKWEFDQGGLTIRIPEEVRQSPPCQHAWGFEVAQGAE